jgi:hypothetical protein
MGRSVKTVHSPEPEQVPINKITFNGAQIAEFGRVDATSGWFKFRCSPGSTLDSLCKKMGWEMPHEKQSFERLDGEFKGGHLTLSCSGKLTKDVDVDIEYLKIKGFELHRLELVGRKGKGFRRELRFQGTFECEDGAANIESYMMRSGNAPGTLRITYLKEQIQENLPLSDESSQLNIPDVHATEEQREAVTN